MTLQLVGLEELNRNLAFLRQSLPEEVAAALFAAGEEIMADSKERYVPVDQGVLKGSGFVDPPQKRGGRYTVALGYGGPAAAYAIVQHERLDYRHTVGGPKFLELPVLEHSISLVPNMAKRIQLRRIA